jgi:hypothetical protein
MDRERRGKAGNVKCYRCGEEQPGERVLWDEDKQRLTAELNAAKEQVEYWRKAWAEAQVKADVYEQGTEPTCPCGWCVKRAEAEQRVLDAWRAAQPESAPICPVHEPGCSCVPQVIADMRARHPTEAEQAVLDAMAAVPEETLRNTCEQTEYGLDAARAELARRKAQT